MIVPHLTTGIRGSSCHISNFELKQYDESLSDRVDDVCQVSEYYTTDQCKCECHKTEKLLIYNLYTALKQMENFTFDRGGDLYTWYYNNVYSREYNDVQTKSAVSEEIDEEMKNFEKEMLKELRLVLSWFEK